MKKITSGGIACFVIGILIVIGFYVFGLYLIDKGSTADYTIAALLFLALGYCRFYNVKPMLDHRVQKMLPFVMGMLAAEIFFSLAKNVNSLYLYTITVSYGLGILLAHILWLLGLEVKEPVQE